MNIHFSITFNYLNYCDTLEKTPLIIQLESTHSLYKFHKKKVKKKVNSDNFIVLPIYIGYIIKYVFLLSNGKNNNTVSKILVISVN